MIFTKTEVLLLFLFLLSFYLKVPNEKLIFIKNHQKNPQVVISSSILKPNSSIP